MIFFPVIFLCVGGLFLALLQDRYRIWVTIGGMLAAYIVALVVSSLLMNRLQGPVLPQQAACAGGVAAFLLCSLFVHGNNPLQKLFVAMLCMSNFAYSQLFLPLLLGAMPFETSGAAGGIICVTVTLLINLLLGACLYRPMQRYSERGPSVFLGGMLVLAAVEYLLCIGRLGALVIVSTPYHLLLIATAVYAVMIFCFRSVYQAGRWQAQEAHNAARRHILEMEAVDFMDMVSAVREVRAAQKSGEYALDTVDQLMREGQEAKIPVYVAMTKRNAAHNPMLYRYHENPYLNAVIATKAAFAAQNQIDFQCSLPDMEIPIKTAELCVMVNEMLSRGCNDAAKFQGDRRLRFTGIPGEDTLRLEAVFSGELPEKPRFSFEGKRFRDLLDWLFDDEPQRESQLKGLDNTAEIALAHSGSLAVSGTGREVIVRAQLRF